MGDCFGVGGEARCSRSGEVGRQSGMRNFAGRLGASVLGLSLLGVGCSRQQSAPTPSPATMLQALPTADSERYGKVTDMRNWRNPYLILRTSGVALLDTADNAEIQLKPEEVLGALANLPASAWPYGRVVAVAQNQPKAAQQDAVAMRRNKGIVGGILEGAHIAVKWVPAS